MTVLTSLGREDLKDIGLDVEPFEQCNVLQKLTQESGLDGGVVSAQEAKMLRETLGQGFALVTPGIRPAGAAADDQKRIVTPKQAMLDGSTHLVIGRPITKLGQSASNAKRYFGDLVSFTPSPLRSSVPHLPKGERRLIIVKMDKFSFWERR